MLGGSDSWDGVVNSIVGASFSWRRGPQFEPTLPAFDNFKCKLGEERLDALTVLSSPRSDSVAEDNPRGGSDVVLQS